MSLPSACIAVSLAGACVYGLECFLVCGDVSPSRGLKFSGRYELAVEARQASESAFAPEMLLLSSLGLSKLASDATMSELRLESELETNLISDSLSDVLEWT